MSLGAMCRLVSYDRRWKHDRDESENTENPGFHDVALNVSGEGNVAGVRYEREDPSVTGIKEYSSLWSFTVFEKDRLHTFRFQSVTKS